MIMHFLPYPPDSGAARRNLGLLREASQRHTVDIVAFVQRRAHPPGEKRDEAIAALREECHSLEVVEVDADRSSWHRVAVLLRAAFSRLPFSSWRYRSSAMRRALARLFAAEQYDLIQVDTVALMPGLQLPRTSAVWLVHHNAESDLMRKRANIESSIIRRAYCRHEALRLRRLERQAMPTVTTNVAVSAADRGRLLAVSPRARIDVLPNGTSLRSPAVDDVSPRQIVLFAGPLTWFPNIDAAMFLCTEIFPLVLAQEQSAILRVVGAQPTAALMGMAARNPSIEIVGYVENYDEELAAATVFVAPFRVGGGTRLKILDALAASTPMVSTSVGCEGLDVTQGEELLIADHPQDFANAIVRVMRDAELRGTLTRAATEFVRRRHDWPVLGDLQDRLMRDAIALHGKRVEGA